MVNYYYNYNYLQLNTHTTYTLTLEKIALVQTHCSSQKPQIPH